MLWPTFYIADTKLGRPKLTLYMWTDLIRPDTADFVHLTSYLWPYMHVLRRMWKKYRVCTKIHLTVTGSWKTLQPNPTTSLVSSSSKFPRAGAFWPQRMHMKSYVSGFDSQWGYMGIFVQAVHLMDYILNISILLCTYQNYDCACNYSHEYYQFREWNRMLSCFMAFQSYFVEIIHFNHIQMGPC